MLHIQYFSICVCTKQMQPTVLLFRGKLRKSHVRRSLPLKALLSFTCSHAENTDNNVICEYSNTHVILLFYDYSHSNSSKPKPANGTYKLTLSYAQSYDTAVRLSKLLTLHKLFSQSFTKRNLLPMKETVTYITLFHNICQ